MTGQILDETFRVKEMTNKERKKIVKYWEQWEETDEESKLLCIVYCISI